MAALKKFNPVEFSKNVTKTINSVKSKIGNVSNVTKSLTNELNAKTGLNIAAPPLPQINSNIRNIIDPVKSIVKNPGGVVKSGAKASFGIASVAIKSGLNNINLTLRVGIKNCLRSAVSSLLSNINLPNVPFGGINPTSSTGISVNGVITNVGVAGVAVVQKKLDKLLNAEITLLANLDTKRKTLQTSVNVKVDIIKNVKSSNYYVANLTSETNKNINNICNTLSPRNKKKLSKGGPIVDIVANTAADKVINNLETQIVKASKGFSVNSPKEFFNNTGIPTVTQIKNTTTSAVNSSIAETTSSVSKAYNNIKDAINSNVPKQG